MNESLSHPVHISRANAQPPAEPPKPRSKWPMGPIAGIVLLSAAVGAGTGAGIATLVNNGDTTTIQPVASTGTNTSAVTSPQVVSSGSVADLYDAVRPSVVKITAASTRVGTGGTGSGLVLDTDGHIITNYHVVQGSNQLDVALSDGTTVSASVVGSDPGNDLAVLKIDPSNLKLTPVKLGDSDAMRIGDNVVAIGNPLDLEATLTEGVISGVGRVLNSDGNSRPLRELIQTDTAINPGNSGGGLFNLNGELIGITNAIENPSGQDSFAGIGYAIPVTTLKASLDQMLAGATVTHARLGVALQDVTPAIANTLGIDVQQGVMVAQIEPGSGAAKAGLQAATNRTAGDVITGIDNHPVKTFDDLANYLDTKKGGDSVTLTIIRNNQQMTLPITLDTWTS
ncbi:MAG TPA: trypsin-like peptidase domain-containing protein [Dehalococcoidia bacterium]|nr:trypsin-like peptidase domain-containing protein [Dehalococcoidia bacterium]